VRVFQHKFTLDDAIGFRTCSREATMRVTNDIPLGCPFFLPVHTENCVQTLKVRSDYHPTDAGVLIGLHLPSRHQMGVHHPCPKPQQQRRSAT
jgi:hypothetical protein